MGKKTRAAPTFDKYCEEVGRCTVAAAAAETVFFAALRLALRDDTDAPIAIWLQFKSSRTRIQMVCDVYRSLPNCAAECTEMQSLAKKFGAAAEVRNTHCHALMDHRPDGSYLIHEFKRSKNGEILRTLTNPMNGDALIKIRRATVDYQMVIAGLWRLIRVFQQRLVEGGLLQSPIISLPATVPHLGTRDTHPNRDTSRPVRQKPR